MERDKVTAFRQQPAALNKKGAGMCWIMDDRIFRNGEYLPPIRVTERNTEQERIFFEIERRIQRGEWWVWFIQHQKPYGIEVCP